jgi:DNA-binding CsgD family transcriptional regulator
LLSAAETAWSAGLTERTLALLDAHAREERGSDRRVPELALRGVVAARTGQLQAACDLLMSAADLATDPDEETVILADAVRANFYLARAPLAARIAERLALLAPSVRGGTARALGLIATGMARVLAGQPGGVDDLRAAVPLLEANPEVYRDPHRLSFVMLVLLFLRDATSARALRGIVDELRGEAGVGALPAVLFHVARDQATTDSWTEAEANYSESVRLAEETGQTTERLMSLAGLCWLESRQGKAEACRVHGDEVLEALGATTLHMAEAWVRFARGDLALAEGDVVRAVGELQSLERLLEAHGIADVDLRPGPELVDALLRLGKQEEALATAADYQRAAESKGQPWALARAARARGLVTDGAGDEPFTLAIASHTATLDRFESARTRLAYGARLRREARRVDAREQLRAALETFEDLGAVRWAEVTAAELRATGETVRQRDADPRAALTPQELQVCLLLVGGRTTREAAAALFLSPKTVEYHLRKVYTKLGIRSRPELAQVLDPRRAG